MWLTHRSKYCAELDEWVFRRLLTFYPEEDLLSRPVLAKALADGEITKADLQKEASVHFIPWQMFLLSKDKLKAQLRNIERVRLDKIQLAELSSRAGGAGATPYRLIDRYIRTQTFLTSTERYGPNAFSGSLNGLSVGQSIERIEAHFAIDRAELWEASSKERALEYLIERLGDGQVNVALGTSEARLVPSSKNLRSLYKNVSGFCLKDARVPFLFVNMNMADEEEPVGRRLYTLMLLLVLVGLGIYSVTRDWRPGRTPRRAKDTYLPHAHKIVSEFFLPSTVIAAHRGRQATAETVQDVATRYKLTPTAVIYRLWREKVITAAERELLTQPPVIIKRRARSPRIDNAVRKLNGQLVTTAVQKAYTSGVITANQAQYVLFGRISRKTWRKYKAQLGL